MNTVQLQFDVEKTFRLSGNNVSNICGTNTLIFLVSDLWCTDSQKTFPHQNVVLYNSKS